MKKNFTVFITGVFILIISSFTLGQEYVADGYESILELNQFDGAPHFPLVVDEVHAGFDLDQDGNLEFIFLADHSNPNGPSGYGWSDGHSVYVYEWNGSSFEKMWSWADTTLKTGGASFPTMAVTDLDGDGNQEIVLGIPSGTDWPAPDVSPTVIYIFEFDSNGGPDEPTASWTANSAPGSNTRPAGMAAGDIDGDGVNEVAVGFRAFSTALTNDALMIFSIDGGFNGPFTQFKVEMIDTTGDWGSVYAVDVTDLDNDGNKEAYFSTDNHTVYEASGADTYTLSFVESPTIGPWTIQATAEGDIDGDGKNELVFGKTNGTLGLWYNITDVASTDSTNEAAVTVVAPGGCRGLTIGDYDNDGNTDIFMGGNYGADVWRVEYKGSGAITDSSSYTYEQVYQDTTYGQRVYSVSFPGDNIGVKQGGSTSTDMNGNGKPELVIAIEDGDTTITNFLVMLEGDGVVGVEIDPSAQVLQTYTLEQNYPNPFNPETVISFSLTKPEVVKLEVYDLLGQKVRTLVNDYTNAGTHSVNWNGLTDDGKQATSGTYIYRLKAKDHQITRKMTLLR